MKIVYKAIGATLLVAAATLAGIAFQAPDRLLHALAFTALIAFAATLAAMLLGIGADIGREHPLFEGDDPMALCARIFVASVVIAALACVLWLLAHTT